MKLLHLESDKKILHLEKTIFFYIFFFLLSIDNLELT